MRQKWLVRTSEYLKRLHKISGRFLHNTRMEHQQQITTKLCGAVWTFCRCRFCSSSIMSCWRWLSCACKSSVSMPAVCSNTTQWSHVNAWFTALHNVCNICTYLHAWHFLNVHNIFMLCFLCYMPAYKEQDVASRTQFRPNDSCENGSYSCTDVMYIM